VLLSSSGMTADLAPHLAAPSLAMLEAVARLIECDPAALATARTIAECDRDAAVAHQIGTLLATVNDDPRTLEQRTLLERARAWHGALVEQLERRRRFVMLVHEHAPRMSKSPGELLDNPVCAWAAAVSDEEIERSKREAELRRTTFGGDWDAELRAYRDGVHPLQPVRTSE
jgi:hypothetical protein